MPPEQPVKLARDSLAADTFPPFRANPRRSLQPSSPRASTHLCDASTCPLLLTHEAIEATQFAGPLAICEADRASSSVVAEVWLKQVPSCQLQPAGVLRAQSSAALFQAFPEPRSVQCSGDTICCFDM